MPTVPTKFDAIIVGAGQAGPPLAGRLTAAGQSVAVIERKLVGGTCVNTGCIPTKTLVASAHAAQTARRGTEYGIGTGDVSVDMTKVKARKDKVMTDDRAGVESWLEGMENCTLIRGHARFTDPHTIAVDDLILQADKIFLNVGGRAVVPDMPGLADVDYMTNVGILDLDTVPEHLVIIGGSYIALEFAQMYRRFGAEVTVIEKGPRLTSREDEDVSAALKEILEKEGIAIELDAPAISFRKQDNGFEVTPREGAHPIVGSHLLVAIGRRPNTDDLGLEAAGVQTDARGNVVVSEQCRTNLDNDQRRISDRVPTYALYIDPPLGRAGLTVDQVRESGRKALVGKRPMTRVGRAVEKGETQGFMKVVVDAETEEILGAAILGVGGDEVIHSILDIMSAKDPYTSISRTMHIHPTVSELVPTMLQEMTPLDRDSAAG